MNRTTRTQPPKGKIVIAGGTGFIGTSLARYLTELSYEVVLLSRHVPERSGAWEHAVWDGRTVGHWSHHLEGADAVVNLTGRTVDCIKSPDHCDEILRSRVEATHVLGKAAHSLKSPPPVWVQMATAGIYGDPPEVMRDEDSASSHTRLQITRCKARISPLHPSLFHRRNSCAKSAAASECPSACPR